MILAGTGHRPSKLWPHDPYNPENFKKLVSGLTKYISTLPSIWTPKEIISGMALGFDQALAQTALDLGIPLHAALPCHGQDKFWPKVAKEYYQELLKKASKVHMVMMGSYAPWKMSLRNKYMVNQSTVLLALWNGTPGGTANCIEYAESVNRTIWRLKPEDIGI